MYSNPMGISWMGTASFLSLIHIYVLVIKTNEALEIARAAAAVAEGLV